jgi:4-alpha-glucanotransferase
MSTADGIHWKGETDVTVDDTGLLAYRYAVVSGDTCLRKEYGAKPHILYYGRGTACNYVLSDYWRDMPKQAHLYSSAFQNTTEKSKCSPDIQTGSDFIEIRAIYPSLGNGRTLAIAGDCPALGNWGAEMAIAMTEVQPGTWAASFNMAELTFPLNYKFVIADKQTGNIEEWEDSDNRTLNCPWTNDEVAVTQEHEIHFRSTDIKVAGTAIPVFSLRSESSFGVGDFGDLKKLVDWAVLTHQNAIQILPINDTTINNTWTDSYPYNSISIYAFHPMYIDLGKLGELKDKAAAAGFEAKRRELNALPLMDYEAVNEAKRAYLKLMFAQDGKKLMQTKGFKTFMEQNRHWLLPYSIFSYLRDKYGTPDFKQWPEHSVYKADEVEALFAADKDCHREASFYMYMQYNLHIQLLEASTYARSKGVILKGDIPIGISRSSVEAWIEPYYFNMNGQAGAPPDAFSVNGQNWGFPTYNWEFMEKDNYKWWRQRFTKMAEYFTAYRIDHILGFFRIWEIPTHSVHGLLGQFSPAMPMSVGEIESYGLTFRKEFMTMPFITEELITRKFADKADEVKATFLQHSHYDVYSMRPEFDTQQKVKSYFADKEDAVSIAIRDSLYELISDVLFVPDRTQPDMYHPRITVQTDYIYERLNQAEKDAFNRLYNDYFYSRHNEFWYREAMKKLPVLTQATQMLVCGEDLGMVPQCVPWVMNDLQILSLEIQSMSKCPEHEFGQLQQYPYRSVCTISTHDTSTMRGWWEEDRVTTQHYYNNELHHAGQAPEHASPELCEEIVRAHLYCPSMLCILSMQDWLSVDADLRNKDVKAERINVPANPRNYWRWRMHITIEQLMTSTRFNDKMRQMIDSAGRHK